jgi:class 3 adenylate cyclase
MRVKARMRTLAARALTESMDVKTMVHLARRLLGNYDLHERTGFPASVPIPNKTAARQIVDDLAATDRFLDFVATLLEVERLGMEGRKYRFPRLQAMVNEVLETGYRFDSDTRTFVEDSAIRTTRNWGVLKEGETYIMAFLAVDVVGNSSLVREYGQSTMSRLYGVLRAIVAEACEKRNGRLWGWEGDGGIAAFTFEEQNQRATLSGMEIINEVFLYNLTDCPLADGLHVRVTVHNGPCEYSESGSELKVDTIKRVWEIDSRLGIPDALIVTDSVYPSLERPITSRLTPLNVARDQEFYTYAVRFVD